ncbi:MAG TPA: LamG-like jellyroll fold domain-containing protein [Cytophagaceae bacterium]
MKNITFYFISLICLVMAIPVLGQVNLDQGLVVYYPLNGDGIDWGPNRRNMSASGSPVATADRFGNTSMAMSFDGSNQYFSAGNYASFQGMQRFTISVWFKTSVLKNQMLVAKHSGGNDGEFYFGPTSDGKIRFVHINSSNNRVDGDFTFAYNDNQWHHAVAVYNGSTMEVFMDGNSIGAIAHTGNTKSTTNPLRIGYYSGSDWFFNGQLDEVHIYNRALNASEIAALGRNTFIKVGNISPVSYCSASNITIPFTVNNTELEENNTFTAYLSDANGSFSNRSIIGTTEATGSGTITGELDKNLPAGSGYRVMVTSSNIPLASAGDNGTNLTITDAVNGLVNLHSNLFGNFPFNGNTGDSSGYGRNLNINSTVNLIEDRYGVANSAYSFDDGYMNWGKIGEINNGGSELTIAMWLKPTSFSTHFIPIANNWNAIWGGVYMGINDSGNGIRWRVNSNSYCVGPDLTLNEWVHVACVFGSGKLKIYYDGVKVAEANSSNITGVDMNFMIGRESSGTSSVHYRGGMDDVRFYKRELSEDEVKAVFHNGLAFNNSGLCIDETLTLSTVTVPGATYAWSGPNGFSSTEQNPSIPNVTSANAGIYTLVITNNGCTNTSTANIIINSELEVITASNDGPVCEGGTINLSSTAISGATYSWSGPNSFSSIDQNPVLSNATTGASGAYTVTITKGACSREAITNATVHPIPSTPTAGSNSPVCEGETLNLTASTVSGATYAWTGPDGFTSTNQNPSRSNMNTDDAGTYSVKAIANGCESPLANVSVTVNKVGAFTASNDGPYCAGEDVKLNVTTISGATYSWSGPDGFISTDQNPVINGAGTSASGSYTITVTLNGCSKQASTNVTVSAPPSVPTAGNNGPICEGEDLHLTAATIAGATYSWTGPNGFTSNTQNPSILGTTTVAASGTYTVTASISGCSNQSSTVVTVNPSPAIPTAGNNGPICEGEALNLTAATVSGVTYVWTGPNGFTGSVQNPSISSASSAASGTYTVTATIGTCSKQSSTNVTVNAVPVAIAGSNSPVCSGNPLNLTATTVSGASYFWSGPNGFSSDIQNPSIVSPATSATGTYTLTVTVGNCSSQDDITVTVNPTPSIPTATNNGPVCEGEDLQLAAAAVTGATYSWSGPNGFTSSVQNPTVSAATTNANGVYTVIATIGNCTNESSTNAIVSAPPVADAGADISVCDGATLNLSANTISGATYSWSGPNNFISDVEDPSIASVTALAGGVYTVTISIGSCSDQDEVNVTVNPIPASPIAGSNSPVCLNDDIELTASTVADATYSWTGPGGFSSMSQNPIITEASFMDAGTYSVKVTVNGCTSLAATTEVSVNTISTVSANNNGPYCEGETINLSASTVAGATYSWTGPGGFTSNLQNPSIADIDASSAGVYTVTVSLGSCSKQNTTSVTVNSGPAKPTITLAQFPTRLRSSSLFDNQWNKDGEPMFGEYSQFLLLKDPGVYTVTVTGTNGCTTTSDPYYYGVTSTYYVNSIGTIEAYPNPSDGWFNITAENIQAQFISLKIQNAHGLEMGSENFEVSNGSLNERLNIQHLAKGVYYLHFETGTSTKVLKVVVR